MHFLKRNLLLLFVALFALPAAAESFRCSGHIISDGMSKEEVLKHCGPPSEENHQTVNSWTYIRGIGQLNVIVYFYANGNIEKIEAVSP